MNVGVWWIVLDFVLSFGDGRVANGQQNIGSNNIMNLKIVKWVWKDKVMN
jgi:hypothetical protein